ncbi:MAG: hypothetical protein A2067_00225 [Deltaproteobacteria bacterium GWB2_42_7]|nr:MAG: hypothetical protein A2067_00225 [Deltaproteobacteria bacterium GWB2_42_7]
MIEVKNNRTPLIQKLATFLATGLYVGYSPYAPGTAGSLLGIIIFYFLSSTNPLLYGIILFFSCVAAIWIVSVAKASFSTKDPSPIVCDEVVGYMVSVFLIPFSIFNAIILFLLFRFFDIVKPFPIRAIDKKIENSFGIVLDDIAAGIYANALFHLLRKFAVL